jgi:hypothetical protein
MTERASDLNHEFLLEGNDIQRDRLLGCENLTMLLLSKINPLDTWQRGCEKNGKLNIAELAKRASKIEDELELRLDKCHFVAGIRATNYLVAHISVTT